VGETETEWNPWSYLRARHPDVYVYVQPLRSGVRACVDVARRAIWLDARQSECEKRCALTFEIAVLERGPVPVIPAPPRSSGARRRVGRPKLIPLEPMVLACYGALDAGHVAERLGSPRARCGVAGGA
jgi:hypothetical protein